MDFIYVQIGVVLTLVAVVLFFAYDDFKNSRERIKEERAAAESAAQSKLDASSTETKE